ncbi:MAG: ABC transporter ATP-binding protein [Clostridiales Family XIII bacterium]|jgi:branched-chain amino acid transport system ATP-binding protein|nr:ABC transporter ATP-binding protein [Clostridiales Family XIII bacterium]
MLKVNNLCAGYEGLEIDHNISIEVGEKQIVAIVGANGVGKSTLLKAITGQIKLMGGNVEFNGEDLSNLPSHKVMRKGVVLVPEGRQLFPMLTVDENLNVGSSTKENRKNRRENKEKIYEMFPVLKERSKQKAGTLSGGEQQMVATSRALMGNPKLLIMDEPSWGLAPILVTEMFEAIKDIRDNGTSILIVEQNVQKTLEIADKAYVIEQGTVVMEGKGSELLLDEDLKKAYLGM